MIFILQNQLYKASPYLLNKCDKLQLALSCHKYISLLFIAPESESVMNGMLDVCARYSEIYTMLSVEEKQKETSDGLDVKIGV